MENNDNDAKKWKKLIIEWKNVGKNTQSSIYAKEKFK